MNFIKILQVFSLTVGYINNLTFYLLTHLLESKGYRKLTETRNEIHRPNRRSHLKQHSAYQ